MNTQTIIYNGFTIRQLLANLPKTFHKTERNLYIKNCIEIYQNGNFNTGYMELIRDSNFRMINNHLSK